MKKKIILFLSVIGVSLLHYLTPVSNYIYHAFFQRLYYIPIILGAYWFGFRWGLIISLLSGVVYAPHIFLQWSSIPMAADGKYIEIVMFVMIASLVGILSDVQKVQQRKLIAATKQIHRMDRLSLLGQLSAGLAHEIRNPLGSLIGSVEILEDDLGPNYPKIEFVTIMHKELNRLRNTLNEFLLFARPAPPQQITNSLNDITKAAVDLVQNQASKASCLIISNFDASLPSIPVDAEQLKQILINLLLNAIQAMPEGGTVTVSTWKESKIAGISVQDEGPGIPSKDIDKIFNPFFSTKKDGTGLGLAIVKQLIEAMNGTITLAESSSGALFEVRMPYE